ncbi:lipocalin family protein [Aquimarina agarivorans]|uniref:lipocalin family protein n=1 Tax=Aquimarina agarivorans TaxID=980584 RepID=UPI000248F279|nr:lipocalin family protein [Aquimarina agarivorans]
MKKITLLLLSTISFSVNAQNSDSIIGKWVFKDAHNKEKIDQAGLDYMNAEIIDKWTFIFKTDGKFESRIMDEIGTGKWKLNENNKTIAVESSEGVQSEFTILKSSKNELVLKLGMGEFLLTRGTNINQVTSKSN